MGGFYQIKTQGGHDFGEVASAFQKCVRRAMIDDAIYWGVELYVSGFHEYAWKRIKIMASEDIGPANPNLPAVIQALYQSFNDQRKKKDSKHEPERLFFVHAIILIASSPKSRIVDHALITHWSTHATDKREIPDVALDKHTGRGRRMGRGAEHFFDEGIKLEPRAKFVSDFEALEEHYGRTAREAMTKKHVSSDDEDDGLELSNIARRGQNAAVIPDGERGR